MISVDEAKKIIELIEKLNRYDLIRYKAESTGFMMTEYVAAVDPLDLANCIMVENRWLSYSEILSAEIVVKDKYPKEEL